MQYNSSIVLTMQFAQPDSGHITAHEATRRSKRRSGDAKAVQRQQRRKCSNGTTPLAV